MKTTHFLLTVVLSALVFTSCGKGNFGRNYKIHDVAYIPKSILDDYLLSNSNMMWDKNTGVRYVKISVDTDGDGECNAYLTGDGEKDYIVMDYNMAYNMINTIASYGNTPDVATPSIKISCTVYQNAPVWNISPSSFVTNNHPEYCWVTAVPIKQ
jgi:hypothetical protein